MSKNKRCPTLAFESEPDFNHTMFPQMASPHGSNLTRTLPLSRNQVPKTSSARPELVVSTDVAKARQKRITFITFSVFCYRSTDICEMHIAQGCRKAAYDEVRDRSMQVFISHGFAGAWRVTVVDLPGGTRELDLYRIVQRRRDPFFNHIERLSVENSDFVECMDQVVRCQHCPVGDEAYPFNLSGTAAEIRFCLGDDDVDVEPLRGHFSLNQLLEWIATNEIDGCNRRSLDRRKGGAVVTDRLHLKTSVQCQGCLLDNQIIEAPGPDREALTGAVVQAGQPRPCEAHLAADRRDDADGLDRLQFGLTGFKHRASADADGNKDNCRDARASTASVHGVPIGS